MPNVLILPEPPSANVYWRHYRGRMVRSKAANDYVQQTTAVMYRAHVSTINKPQLVEITVRWYRSRRSGDLDNRLKALLDALQGYAYDNDAQIVRIHAERFDDPENPRMEVEIGVAA